MPAAAPSRFAAPATPERRRALVFPREHGAWGMLFVPLATGAAVGLRNATALMPLFLLTLAAFALFCLRTPVEALLGTSAVRATGEGERSYAASWAMIYAATAGLAVSHLLQNGFARGLLAIGAVAALAFAAQALLRKVGRGARMMSQIAGAVGLTSTAAAAYYVVTGRFDATAAALWAINFAFAADQIHYVQVRIHQGRPNGLGARFRCAPGFFIGQILFLAAVYGAAAFGGLPWLAVAAILPSLVRGFYWYMDNPRPLAVRRLGHHELAHALAFGLLLVAAYWIA